ncbi:hypothetical protein [Dactylosporangium sp. NPDC051541]|uniref:hypothetical protein n=1 Tax=Dactylosporangium sp. NPDC051541 TaxID=3363977 RepID=UPI00379D33B2
MPNLSVSGPHEFSYLRVLDPHLREVAGGTHRLDVAVPPGLYRIEARGPGTTEERLVVVGETDDVSVTGFTPALDSPAPLPTVRTHHETQTMPADRTSRREHVVIHEPGSTGRLFLFIRNGVIDPLAELATPTVVVQDETGRPLARLDGDGEVNRPEQYAALSVRLPAGTYVLAHVDPVLGRRGQAVLVEEGWQTQVFASWNRDGIGLDQALVRMVRGLGFNTAEEYAYQHVEAALNGLAANRVALTARDEQDLLDAKFTDPMLGLTGAYAYLLRGDVDTGRLAQIARNLTMLLPHSPDAHLLARLTGGPDPTFEQPPMFATGVERLIDLAARDASLVGAAGWLANVALTRTTGSVWTRWNLDVDPGQRFAVLAGELADGPGATGHPDPADVARAAGLPLSVVLRALTAGVFA